MLELDTRYGIRSGERIRGMRNPRMIGSSFTQGNMKSRLGVLWLNRNGYRCEASVIL